MEDPFPQEVDLLRRLQQEKTESRHLEWKLDAPLGSRVTKRTKYRVVKALISFANTEGGFVICGVDPQGEWKGIEKPVLDEVDQAKIIELSNGSIYPGLVIINYRVISIGNKFFALIHTPPSYLAPHVTIKDVVDQDEKGKTSFLISKHAVYCRHGSKCDLANPQHYERIIQRRTDFIKAEMVRRVKEVHVTVPIPMKKSDSALGLPILQYNNDSKALDAPTIRITRNPEEASGLILIEQLSDDVFKDINKVLHANELLSGKSGSFVLNDAIYYGIYSQREQVVSPNHMRLLARHAFFHAYAPSLYWFKKLPPSVITNFMKELAENPKGINLHYLYRLVIILGQEYENWLRECIEKKMSKDSKYSDILWRINENLKKKAKGNRILRAAKIHLEAFDVDHTNVKEISTRQLLSDTKMATAILSAKCDEVYKGSKIKSICRALDFIAYGKEIQYLSEDIKDEFHKIGISISDDE